MMIRLHRTRAGETGVLIRVRWDPERGRSAQRVLYTFPADSAELPLELVGPEAPLTPPELAQAQAWLDARNAARRAERLRSLPRQIAAAAMELTAAVEGGLGVRKADRAALRDALHRLLPRL